MKKLHILKKVVFKPMYYFFKFIIILMGSKQSKPLRLIDSTIYEMRIMTLFSFIVLGLYFFIGIVDNSSDPELIKIIIKISGVLLVTILFLVFRIAIKLNFKYKYHRCNKKECSCTKRELDE